MFLRIGSKNARQISPAVLPAVVRRIEEPGAIETAHWVRGNCSQELRCAIATQRAECYVTVDLRGAIPTAKVCHFSAVIELGEVALMPGTAC